VVWAELLSNGIAIGSIYILVALGLTMIYGVLRVLHIAHAGIFTLGAYLGLLFYNLSDNLLISLIGVMIVCGFAGILTQRFIYRPLLPLPRIIALIASIGLFIAMQEIFRLIAGAYILSFPVELSLEEVELGSFRFTSFQILIFLVTLCLLGILWVIMSRTKAGLEMKATAQDTEMASVLGINTSKIVAFTFFIGSAFAGSAGVLIGIMYNSVYPTMGSVAAYKSLAVIVLGGIGNIMGTVLGGLLLGVAETLLIGMADIPLPRDSIAFIVMIFILLFRPQGLLGRK
jgi:branched-chain amino acid transport system permease protein